MNVPYDGSVAALQTGNALWDTLGDTLDGAPVSVALPGRVIGTLIVGGGPAGLAPLIAASRTDALERILAGGLAIAERGPTIGAGRIGGYAINSDSTAETILSCVRDTSHPALAALDTHPITQAVASHGRGPVPLKLVGSFLSLVGAALQDAVTATPGNLVLPGHEAISLRQTAGGLWLTRLRNLATGAEPMILSRQVVLAAGGHQPESRLRSHEIGGVLLLPRYDGRLVQSDAVLTPAGLAAICRRLADSRHKRLAIVGSASSALACAHSLLHSEAGASFGPGAVTVLHRRPLRVFYPSAAEALADGYDEFGPADICPRSGFVFRCAGFRLESRELVMGARSIGGRRRDPRLRLHHLAASADPEALAILDAADIVIAALGYRPRTLPVTGAAGLPIPLLAAGTGPLVDDRCRVLDAAGQPIPGLLGIGLAAGFASHETAGGEPSFSGQTNSLWLWQNDIGALIAAHMTEAWAEAPALDIPLSM